MKFIEGLKAKENPLNLPNLLTLFRLLLIPVMAWLLAYDRDQPSLEQDFMFRYSPGRLASVVVMIAGVTDLLDGWLARRWKIESLMGKFLDPLADKLFLLVGLVMLMELDRVSCWLVILLLSREILITGLRSVAVGEGIVIPAGNSGKWKLTFQLTGLGLLMWYGSAFTLSAYEMGTVILYIALAISLYSGYCYLYDFFVGLSKLKQLK